MLAQLGTFATRLLERHRQEVTPDMTVYAGEIVTMNYRDGAQRVLSAAQLEEPGAYAAIARRAFTAGINCPPDPASTKTKLATR